MTRKLTGSTLAVVLIALVAVKHLALGFCLCDEELFIAECRCCCISESPDAPCHCEEESPANHTPGKDCVVAISLDAGDFLWSADAFNPNPPDGTTLSPAETPFLSSIHAEQFALLGIPIRGSPPGGPPPFLRTTVLRL